MGSGGGIGRHAGLKILWAAMPVRVRFPSRAQNPENKGNHRKQITQKASILAKSRMLVFSYYFSYFALFCTLFAPRIKIISIFACKRNKKIINTFHSWQRTMQK